MSKTGTGRSISASTAIKAWGEARLELLERVVLVLIGIDVLLYPLQTLPNLPGGLQAAMDVLIKGLHGVFVVEYVLRIGYAKQKWRYLLSLYGIFDFLAVLGSVFMLFTNIGGLRAVRLMRLFRIVRSERYMRAIRRFMVALGDAKEEMVVFLAVSLILLYLSAIGIYYFEHEVQPEAFATVLHALWWAVVTLTTVGYGDVYPLSTGGKIFAGFVVWLGVALIGVPAGIVAAALSKASRSE